MRSPLTTPAGILFTFALLTLGCEKEVPTEFATGQLAIVTTTSGDEPDPDGYTVQVDGDQPQPIGATGQLQPSTVAAGDHTVIISGIAANCSAAEGVSQTVRVPDRSLATVTYTVTCSATVPAAAKWTRIPLPSSVTAAIGLYQGRTLWGTSPSDLFVIEQRFGISPRSAIWHYDGTAWAEQVSRVDTTLNGIWGFSGSDVYAAGNGTLDAGMAPVILHYDGTRWSEMAPPVSGVARLSGLWGAGPQDVFLGGTQGDPHPASELLAHFDGSGWSSLAVPVFGDFSEFMDLGGTSGADVWAVGKRQTCEDCNYETAMIVHYDGQGWTQQLSKNADVYAGVWAVAPNDVWVVGRNDEGNANVLHYDGSGWSRGEPLSTSQNGLQDVWASSSNDVYAVGPRVLLHYDGTAWSKVSEEGGDRVWGTSENDVFILRANEILHRNR
jgi:hypothetical protein